MKNLLCVLLLVAALPAVGLDLGSRAPAKPTGMATPPPADPAVFRQGGDTFIDAVPLTIPVSNQTGTTVGYNDDYDEVCPYIQSTAPDVVYTLTPQLDMTVEIDLFGSAYDTKIYVYDENLTLVACNDDFYSDYTSKIEALFVAAGALYYLVIDGYGGEAGEYLLNIGIPISCILECPAGAVTEDEPPLTIDYVDLHNGGCNTDPDNPPFQPLDWYLFCGRSGYYLDQGNNSRDTDWFTVQLPAEGRLDITGDAELACDMLELAPQDCGSMWVLQSLTIGPCSEGTMTIMGTPGSTVWLWVGPTTFQSPDGSDVYEFDYVLDYRVLVATENHTWSEVKALFD